MTPHRRARLAGELRVVIGRLRRRLREQADLGGLTTSQVAVLGRLDRNGPATVTALAQAEGMRPQSMGANVAVLEQKGLVRGAADPRDGRRTILHLTPACRKWVAASRAAREDWLASTLAASFTPAEQDTLARALALLQRLADAPTRSPSS